MFSRLSRYKVVKKETVEVSWEAGDERNEGRANREVRRGLGVRSGLYRRLENVYSIRYCTLKPRQHCFIRLTVLYALMELNAYAITLIRVSIWIMGGRSSDLSITQAGRRTVRSALSRTEFRFFVGCRIIIGLRGRSSATSSSSSSIAPRQRSIGTSTLAISSGH